MYYYLAKICIGLSILAVCGGMKYQDDFDFAISNNMKKACMNSLDGECIHLHEYYAVSSVEATCSTEGVVLKKCICGAEKKEIIETIPHEVLLINGCEATYLHDGKEYDKYCSVCQCVVEEGKDIPAKILEFDKNTFEVPDYIYTLSSEQLNTFAGYNPKVDENNRPLLYENLQEKIAKYNAFCLGKESEDVKKIYLFFTASYEAKDKKTRKSNIRAIMDICDEKGIKAAFFLTGEYVRNNPKMVKEICDRGFLVGSHCYDHTTRLRIYQKSPIDQFEDHANMYKLLKETTGQETVLFCPSYGGCSEQSLAIANELGFKTILYSSYYNDSDSVGVDLEKYYNTLKKRLHEGEVLYLHTVAAETLEMLPNLIEDAFEKGLTFGSLLEIE